MFLGMINATVYADGSDRYALATGASAASRLTTQDKLLRTRSYHHLNQAGLSEGKTVWDIGCGNGMMTVYIAKAVGPKGHIYAMDASQEQLNIAKKNVEEAGLHNVTFIHGDIQSDKQHLIMHSADIVYARMLLMHLPDPEKAIANIKLILKKNGILASQETIMSSGYCSYHTEEYKKQVEAMVSLGEHLGVDYDIGNKLKNLYKSSGFTKITEDIEPVYIPSEMGKEMINGGLREWKDKAILANIITSEDIKRWENIYNNMPTDDPTFILAFNVAYIIATI